MKKFKKLQKNEKEIFDKILNSSDAQKRDEKLFEQIWFILMKQLETNKKSSIFPKFLVESSTDFFVSLCDSNRFKEEVLKVFKMLGKGGEYELKTETTVSKKSKQKKEEEDNEVEDFGNDRFAALRKLVSPTTFNFLM